MKHLFFTLTAATMVFLLWQCNCNTTCNQTAENGVIKTEVKQVNGKWTILRNGQPYKVQGAGIDNGSYKKLAEAGGNSIRTWRTDDAEAVFDSAKKYGFTVLLCLELGRERLGFDYNDTSAVNKQLRWAKQEVLKFKDRPELLMWAMGNELNLFYKNYAVWKAMNEIAKMIHEVDPNHPVTTLLAGVNKADVDSIKAYCPELDVLGVQSYGDIPNIPRKIVEYGWTGPYIITEYGATGHWEVPLTSWGVAIEEHSGEKAKAYSMRYDAIAADTIQSLGAYAFLWGQKQERTSTWYGLFLETGESTEAVDVLQYKWTGKWPANRCPQIDSVKLDGKDRYASIHLQPGKEYNAIVFVTNLDNDKLQYEYVVLHESTDLKDGGDHEKKPDAVEGIIVKQNENTITLKAPQEEGPYRLFFYVHDGYNHAGTANIPFFVKK